MSKVDYTVVINVITCASCPFFGETFDRFSKDGSMKEATLAQCHHPNAAVDLMEFKRHEWLNIRHESCKLNTNQVLLRPGE